MDSLERELKKLKEAYIRLDKALDRTPDGARRDDLLEEFVVLQERIMALEPDFDSTELCEI